MEAIQNKENLLRKLPGVDRILELAKADDGYKDVPKSVLVNAIRFVIEELRRDIITNGKSSSIETQNILIRVKRKVEEAMQPNLRRLVNGTGVVVHTNLGRSLLPEEAVAGIMEVAAAYSNLEFDISQGKRGLRYSCIEDILCQISGAEAGMVVNNNAAAVLLCLETMAKGKEVIVSRGELIEIGGSFRIPDVMAKSGGILKEVGTTNRTHAMDYKDAVTSHTGLLLKVHTSNYSVMGFTAEVSLKELVEIGAEYNLPVMEDLGSGTFIDFSRYGLTKEPTVQESVKTGADIVTFSGDKLLGGPQAGLIVGKKEIVEKIRKNPLTRALRIDKLTLSALERTLRLYRDPDHAVKTIPTLRMLTDSFEYIEKKADRLLRTLEKLDDPRLQVNTKNISSKTGGGALPMLNLRSKGLEIRIKDLTAGRMEKAMRSNNPPVIGRIEEDVFLIDLRTILDDEFSILCDAVSGILQKSGK
jgi:L-seryl-tRNA(Ser) seleniumtransferase